MTGPKQHRLGRSTRLSPVDDEIGEKAIGKLPEPDRWILHLD
jgi:hypothetical protein